MEIGVFVMEQRKTVTHQICVEQLGQLSTGRMLYDVEHKSNGKRKRLCTLWVNVVTERTREILGWIPGDEKHHKLRLAQVAVELVNSTQVVETKRKSCKTSGSILIPNVSVHTRFTTHSANCCSGLFSNCVPLVRNGGGSQTGRNGDTGACLRHSSGLSSGIHRRSDTGEMGSSTGTVINHIVTVSGVGANSARNRYKNTVVWRGSRVNCRHMNYHSDWTFPGQHLNLGWRHAESLVELGLISSAQTSPRRGACRVKNIRWSDVSSRRVCGVRRNRYFQLMRNSRGSYRWCSRVCGVLRTRGGWKNTRQVRGVRLDVTNTLGSWWDLREMISWLKSQTLLRSFHPRLHSEQKRLVAVRNGGGFKFTERKLQTFSKYKLGFETEFLPITSVFQLAVASFSLPC